MPAAGDAHLIDRDGRRARLIRRPGGSEPAIVILDGETEVRIPRSLRVRRSDSVYELVVRFEDLQRQDLLPSEGGPEAGVVIPVIAELAHIETVRRVTGKVRLRETLREQEEVIDQPLLRERVRVERVAIDRWVDESPQVRHEAATLIIPVLEEVLVVEKRLRPKEEVRVTWQSEKAHEPQRLVLRREEGHVEPIEADDDPNKTTEIPKGQ
jgi:hypothetical protein